jgi:hypothetical protein
LHLPMFDEFWTDPAHRGKAQDEETPQMPLL